MRKDPTEFRERFKRWKAGEKVYEAGLTLPAYDGGTQDMKFTKDYSTGDLVAAEDLDDVVVSAPRLYTARYDENGNRILTADKNLSMSTQRLKLYHMTSIKELYKSFLKRKGTQKYETSLS